MDLLYSTPDPNLPSLEAARIAFNSSPATPDGVPLPPGAQNPQIATVPDFLRYLFDRVVADLVKKHAVQVKITRKQGLKALARAELVGLPAPITEQDVIDKINLMPELTLDQRIAKIDTMTEFKNAPTWVKGNPFFEGLCVNMGITPDQRDALLAIAGSFQD